MKTSHFNTPLHGRGKTLICLAIILFIVVLPAASIAVFSQAYADVYRQPKLVGGEIDIAGFDLKQQDIDLNLKGEWEYFYGDWIITDGTERERDGFIELPSKWSSVGKPAYGYGSYKITVKNVKAGTVFGVILNNYRGAFRAFINGELVAESGTVSKNGKEERISGRVNGSYPYTTEEDGDIELVVEVSAGRGGGLYVPVWLHVPSNIGVSGRTVTGTGRIIPIIVLVLLCLVAVLDISLRKYKRNALSVVFAAFLFVHTLATKETSLIWTRNIALPYLILPIACYITAIGAFFVHIIATLNADKRRSRAVAFSLLGASIALFAATVLSEGYAFQIAFPVLWIASMVAVFVLFCEKSPKNIAVCALLGATFLAEAVDLCGCICFGTEGIASIMLLPVIAMLLVGEIYRLTGIAASLKELSDIKRNMTDMKQTDLNAQALPHYAFNTLAIIKAVYRKSTEEGERALDRFCHRLRYETDYRHMAGIPLRVELEECESYAELEEMKGNGHVEILFDIEDEDFEVPQYSVFNLVENAYKYAFTETESPLIVVSAYKDDGNAVVRVADNGCGLSRESGGVHTGLRNTRERIELSGGKMEIYSEKGKGTTVTLTIPLKGAED